MYSKWQLALKYLVYYFTSSGGKGHGTHSPFLYHFITRILNDTKQYEAYEPVEKLRKDLWHDPRHLLVEDFGAGSAFTEKYQRSVRSIARLAAKSKKYGQLLFRMVKHYQPSTLLELGSSLGITSSYLSMARPEARLITMEGAHEIAAVARQNFGKLGLKNIELLEGNFDDNLPPLLNRIAAVDFAFVDGNHRREPTERYFSQLLGKTHNDSILVFDDIHWSREMEAAWDAIKAHPVVRCSIDLFFIGFVLFRREFHEKQHFSIRF